MKPYKPAYSIKADDTDITAKVAEHLMSITISDESGFEADTVEITISDTRQTLALPRLGVELSVAIGYEGELVDFGTYQVDELELNYAPDSLRILGRATDLRGEAKNSKTREWHEKTLGSIVESIAKEHDLVPAIAKDLAGIAIKHIDQIDESDFHFLSRIAKTYGAISKPVSGRWVFKPKLNGMTASGKTIASVSLSPQQVTSVRASLASRDKYKAVSAYYNDLKTKKREQIKAGEGEPVYQMRHTYATAKQASDAAHARLKTLSQSQTTLSLTCPGNTNLVAEGLLYLAGFRDGIDGTWRITRVTHTLNNNGFTTSLDAEGYDELWDTDTPSN